MEMSRGSKKRIEKKIEKRYEKWQERRYPDLPFCVVVWLPSYMTEPHPEIGAAFPDSPVRLWIAAYAKLAPDGAQTYSESRSYARRIYGNSG